MTGALRALGLGLALALAPMPGLAEPRDTDETAYTLAPGETRAGLWKVQHALPPVGPVPSLEIGTFAWPWLLWAANVRLVNVHAKSTLYDDGVRAVAARAGLFYVNLARSEAQGRLAIVPVAVFASHRLPRDLTLSAGLVLASAGIRGAYDEEDVALLQGAVAARSLQALTSLEWRVSRRFAITARSRLVAFSNLSAAFDGSYRLDDYTRIDAAASGGAEVRRGLGLSAGMLAHWAWRRLNLKVGAHVGNYTIPGVHFVVPSRVVVPELDLYWRF
jgi:hypothetical protein